ncbi:MAG: purine-binding chemotaxis protein CheW [Gomphosphaeria aponina SAG 52.96 = DSM 107014]|uniref:Purine-binding chemotaxis protein CheW n=1 Tax=Gomphosphaeria aponina SAG 52.96 = DSM 107014 TaxID=1521640 RepID=A0A941GRF0_9CHRO|nr:purine-binding chemotaxis protein CheW [Gomphosphaeria aponina SAG 52.96 = DSM 107014]
MNTSTLKPKLSQLGSNLGEPYLRLQLERNTSAALEMKHSQEVITVPVGRIAPMPNMPDFVLGLLNQRSRVFWVVDLPQMLELQPLEVDVQNYNIAIVRVGNMPLALAVREVKGVMRLQAELIQSPLGTVSPSLTAYVRGCVLEKKEVLLVLEPEAIVNASVLQTK